MPVRIEDPADPRIADYTGLRDAELRHVDDGVFIAEGKLVIRRLMTSPYSVRSLLLTPKRAVDLADIVAAVRAPVYVAEPDVVRHAVGFDLHRGALAAADRLPLPDPAALLASSHVRTLVVLEQVGDHENLGAIFRSASALGADAVALCPRSSDPLYRRCVRVSMGEVLALPFTRLEPWPRALTSVRAAGFTLVALSPGVDARPIGGLGRPSGRVALLLGSEGSGLSADAVAAADVVARIPMRAGVDSLNIGHAAAIALHRLAPIDLD